MQKNNRPLQRVGLRLDDEYRNPPSHARQSLQGWFFYTQNFMSTWILMANQYNKSQQCQNKHSKSHQVLKRKLHRHHLPSYVIGRLTHLAVTRLFINNIPKQPPKNNEPSIPSFCFCHILLPSFYPKRYNFLAFSAVTRITSSALIPLISAIASTTCGR